MSDYDDIENIGAAYFGDGAQCEWCYADLEDEDHDPGCPLSPDNAFFDEEISLEEEM